MKAVETRILYWVQGAGGSPKTERALRPQHRNVGSLPAVPQSATLPRFNTPANRPRKPSGQALGDAAEQRSAPRFLGSLHDESIAREESVGEKSTPFLKS